MTSWDQFAAEAPELAAVVRGRFEAHLHHIVGTLRADGSPRLSGTEARFFEGELLLGSMPDSRKGADLRRDPRMALHAAPTDVELATGDAKVSGRAVALAPEDAARFLRSLGNPEVPTDAEVFRIDIELVALTRVEGDELCVDVWRTGSGLRSVRRS